MTLSISSLACASKQIIAQSFQAEKDLFFYNLSQRELKIKPKPTISDWNINCDRTRAVVWGRDWDNLKIGSPPFSIAYLIDINHGKIIAQFTMTRGPYEAIFSQDKKMVSIDEIVIDLSSGNYINSISHTDLTPESCPTFPGKHSNMP